MNRTTMLLGLVSRSSFLASNEASFVECPIFMSDGVRTSY